MLDFIQYGMGMDVNKNKANFDGFRAALEILLTFAKY